ncbi:hypothetical protein P3T76_000550 [Phytophthora citrophthora]|uniref:Uncharacterized protein n=1 Tax=Phytophthora citrophthora TaxID=4793 RepID=A0AAD9LSF8_9STRA|nr:hypothetical protein P3T76_000550 [Phytophthora citrophthora]
MPLGTQQRISTLTKIKMLVRPRGWDDDDVLALLMLFRKHLMYYVYTSDGRFAEVMRAELPDKEAADILQMVRGLMEQFGLQFSTKNFRTDVIVANGYKVFVYEHIYESIRLLPENKAGGVWLPDELSRFLQKAKQYRDRFTDSQEKYFKQVQLWGKSIAETKSKFYALRELFIREKRHPHQRTEVGAARLELLTNIFNDVPPARRPEKVASAPNSKLKLWSSEEMESLVDFLVRITAQIQRFGCSELVNRVAETLREYALLWPHLLSANAIISAYDSDRTDGSCVNKLGDMRDKFLNKSTTIRAVNWKDPNDPYALGYLAMRARNHKLSSERRKKQRTKDIWSHRPKLRSVTKASSGTNSAPSETNMSTRDAAPTQPAIGGPRNQVKTTALQTPSIKKVSANTLPANDYAAFVQDIAKQCRWTEKLVHVLRCMQCSIELYRSNKLVDFFYKIASLTPGFGTLDGFENLVLIASNNKVQIPTSDQETKEQDNPPNHEANEVSVATSVQDNPREQNASNSHSSEESIAGDDEQDNDQVPVRPPGQQVSYTSKENADAGEVEDEQEHSSFMESPTRTVEADSVVDEDEQEHGNSPLLESPSPTQTPQTGNEDAADEHSSGSTGKLFSPEDHWDDGADADADLDDDGSDNESVASSDNAWSGSSNASDAKETDRHAKDNAYPLSSKKPAKRGKDEQYGKSFDLAKKRRLDANVAAIDDREDDDDDQSEEIDDDQLAEGDSMSSDGELEETPHPLQSILDSLDAHMVELQRKQRILIERKEDREYREPRHHPFIAFEMSNASSDALDKH